MNFKKIRLDKQIFFFRDYFDRNNLSKSKKSMFLVLDYHVSLRKDGSPEATHMYDVAGSVLSLLKGRVSNFDLDILVTSAFLHDLIEDYPELYSLEDLKKDFGEDVFNIVSVLSKPNSFIKDKESYDKYYFEICKDYRAIIIKAKDRIDNFKTMKDVFTIKRQKEYILEVKTYILPMLKKSRHLNDDIYMIMTDLIHQLNEQIEQYEWLHNTISELGLLNSSENKRLPELIKRHNKKKPSSNLRR